MTNQTVAVVETEVVVYGRIELEALSVEAKVKEVIADGDVEFTLFNTNAPMNMFHENGEHMGDSIAFNSFTVVADGVEHLVPIDSYNLEIEYIEDNKFVATFCISTNINTEILNNGEIEPLEVVIMGWDYNTDGTEQFINTSVETTIHATEFVEEY